MLDVRNKRVLVLGLGRKGQAAARLLVQHRAEVVAVDPVAAPGRSAGAAELRSLGIPVRSDPAALAPDQFDLAVLASDTPTLSDLRRRLARAGVPVISELELGCRFAQCLLVGITGAAGKRTTMRLLEEILEAAQRRTGLAGGDRIPLSDLAEASKELEFIAVEVSPWELEATREFRPMAGVLLNLPGDERAADSSSGSFAGAVANLFARQQAFDWAIVQLEALEQFRAAGLTLPAKTVTFSAAERKADFFLDRGLIISQLPDWNGPLINLTGCQSRGSHFAEDVMAALAVGRVLRIPLEVMVDAIQRCPALPHRCESIGTVGGVEFISDALAVTLSSTRQAVLSIPAFEPGESNILMIAGGADSGGDFHDLGPLLARRVKQVFLFGEVREKLRAAWSLFTPCTLVGSVLEAATVAVQSAVPGDVVLLSPACSSREPSTDEKSLGEVFREAVRHMGQTTGGGASLPGPIPWGAGGSPPVAPPLPSATNDSLLRRLLREDAGAKPIVTSDQLHP
ncbi:MAG: Mur ligase family protein [Limisphaerales bacterium]